MKLLALDTSSIACSVALQLDDVVTERHEEQAREHTRLLVPMIRSLLEEAAIALDELDAIVLGNGPGSFIGMRIAASLAQGLAHGAGLDIVPVSSLAIVAAEVFATSDATEVVVTQDAHMQEVYLGTYRRDPAGLPVLVAPERLQAQQTIADLEVSAAGGRAAAGAGWQRYPLLLQCNGDKFDSHAPILHPRARFSLGLGAAELAAGRASCPAELVPAYLRQQVAAKPAPPS